MRIGLRRVYWNIRKKISLPPPPPKQLEESIAHNGLYYYFNFDIDLFKTNTNRFINELKCLNKFEYKYAKSTTTPNIYSSVYVCLIYSLFGELDKLNKKEKRQWADYFDSFQNADDGFFYDKTIKNDIYIDTDWWGARHLVPHIIMAYTSLGEKPRFRFKWIEKYYDINYLKEWLDTTDWTSPIPDENDIDNKIMNIGVTLQYQRDFLNDKKASESLFFLKNYLREKINKDTGFWGNYNVNDQIQHARMIQFSYHLLRIFFYDNESFCNEERMIDLILESQNRYGGFGVSLNSSACEDIDAIEPLIYFAKNKDYRKEDIKKALQRALIFVLSNYNEDGGFVFRRDEAFQYGCQQMSSERNESALFPTWFRTNCLYYLLEYLNIGGLYKVNCPGY